MHSGQGQALTIDQQQLYRSLYLALDDLLLALPASPLPAGIDDDDHHVDGHLGGIQAAAARKSKHTHLVNIAQATAQLLDGMLLDRRALDGGRLLALTKAVARAAVYAAEPGMAAGCLAVLQRMLRCVGVLVLLCGRTVKHRPTAHSTPIQRPFLHYILRPRRHAVLQGLLEDPASGPLGTSGPLWGTGADEDDLRSPALQVNNTAQCSHICVPTQYNIWNNVCLDPLPHTLYSFSLYFSCTCAALFHPCNPLHFFLFCV